MAHELASGIFSPLPKPFIYHKSRPQIRLSGLGRPKHALALYFLNETQPALVLDQPDLCKRPQSGQRVINLLDLLGRQDLQRLVQGQCARGIAFDGLLSLSHFAVPFDPGGGIAIASISQKPIHNIADRLSGFFTSGEAEIQSNRIVKSTGYLKMNQYILLLYHTFAFWQVLKKSYFLDSFGLVNYASEYYYFVHFFTN